MRAHAHRQSLLIGAALWAAFGLGACARRSTAQQKPTKDCLAAEAVLDRSLALRRFSEARALRPDTYTKCGDRPELRARDQRLVDAEAEQAELDAANARRRQRALDVVRTFLDFVAEHRGAPEQASIAPHCALLPTPPGAPPEPTRWCTASRRLGASLPLEIRYAEATPGAFVFSVASDGLDCASVAGTELRRWQVALPSGGSIRRARCALGARLAGLTAVVSSGEASMLYVTSPRYLELEPRARPILDP